MPSIGLHFHPAALAEAEAARDRYEGISQPAADAFLLELDHAISQVSEAPTRWRVYIKDTRRYIFPRFPFALVYRVRGDLIEVLAVAHHRRKPGYWSSRT